MRNPDRIARRGEVSLGVSASASSFADAVAREAPVLLAAARMVTLNEAEAWDVMQATLEIALEHATALRDPESLRPWLLSIQSHEAFRIRRRFRRFVPLDSAREVPEAGPPMVDRVSVRDALRALPPRTRNAVVLHYMTGLSVAEVAGAMGVTENTVKSQLKAGMARLREAFRDDQT